ncbi:MAG: zinc-binding dehydrogenase [Thermaerobacterales bacterium]
MRLAGADTVVGTVGSHEKAAVAREVGCDVVINYRQENFAEAVQGLVDAAAAGQLNPVIGGIYPLSEAARAHDLIANRRSVGRILLRGPGQGP